jgi:hypothetical protein
MRGQSKEAQDERLAEGRCPIHGLWISQVEGWYHPTEGRDYTIVGCLRKDCTITDKAYSIEGPWKLIDGDHVPPPQRNPYNDDARAAIGAALVTLDRIEMLARQHGETDFVRSCSKLRSQLKRGTERLDW